MTVLAARPRRVLAALAGLTVSVSVPACTLRDAHAEKAHSVESPPPALTEAQTSAQEHYKLAKDLYQSGSYREARAELEAARELDPEAKELVFNLGVVNEKLGQFDDALRYFRQYAEMNLSAAEKQRADGFIKRLEGAKNEVVPPRPQPESPPPVAKVEKTENGRIDAATVAVASIGVVGLGVGAAFGIKALSDKPKLGFITGRDGSYTDLQRAADSSYAEAVVADVALGVGVAATAVAAYLYFSRPKVVSPPSSRASVSVSVTPTPGGAAFSLRGSF